MPANMPYPGESAEQFQQRMALQRTQNWMASGEPFNMGFNLPQVGGAPTVASGGGGAAVPFAYPQAPAQPPLDLSLAVPEGNVPPPTQDMKPDNMQQPGVLPDFSDELGTLGNILTWQPPWLEGIQDAIIQGTGLGNLFAPDGGEEVQGPPPQPSPAGTPFSQDIYSGMGGGSAGDNFTMRAPLPQAGRDAFSQEELPTIDREVIDQFLREMRGTEEGFDPKDLNTSQALAAMGQMLAQAGPTPTMGEALLALGTGASTAKAQHEMEQDELRRAFEQRQTEFDRAMLERELAGEQALIESEQQARQFEQQQNQLEAQQDAQRLGAIADRTQVEVNDDNVVITEPVMENGRVTDQIQTTVLDRQKREAIMDAEAIKDMDLEVAGRKVGDLMQGLSQEGQGVVLGAAQVVNGTIPATAIPIEGAQETFQFFEQQARQRVMQRLGGGEEGASLAMIAQRNNLDIDDLQDMIEDEHYRIMMAEMQNNPILKAGVFLASGNPALARRAQVIMNSQQGGQNGEG